MIMRSFKYIVLSLVGLLAFAGPATAQLLPDNEVQLVAYWEVGDKYYYQNESTKSLIQGTDTTVVEKSAALVSFEVLAQTDSTYRLRYDSSDYKHSDYIRMQTMEVIDKTVGPMPIDFETNEFGEPLAILPLEWGKISDAMVDACVDEVMLRLDSLRLDRDMVSEYLRSALNPDLIQHAAEDEISKLFQFHGHRFTIDEHYPYQAEFPNFFSAGGTILMNGEFWVSGKNTNEDVVEILVYQIADPENLKEAAVAYLRSLGLDVDSEEARKELTALAYNLEDYMLYRFHLGTGWLLNYVHVREVVAYNGDTPVRHDYQGNSYEIILED